ncbi:MAG TPA: DUF2975 domain-containing protein [Ferruginibacter sp.]|nr:DUF2975 domain-containing protein [Ferruginibacter sp.]
MKKMLPKDTAFTWPRHVKQVDSLHFLMASEKDGSKISFYKNQVDSILNDVNKSPGPGLRNIGKEAETDYYISLSGYSLSAYDSKFFIYGDKYFLTYTKIDSVVKSVSGTISEGHYEKKEIPVRFTKDNLILIPISRKAFSFFHYLFYPVAIITGLLFIYFFLGLPTQVLVTISKGKAFTGQNIKNIKWISSFLIIFTLIKLLSPYFFHLIFFRKIPADFAFTSPLNYFTDNFKLIAFTLIITAIRTAFLKGYKLQQEQDLTV